MSTTPRRRGRALLAGLLAAGFATSGLIATDLADAPPSHAHGSFGTLATGEGPTAVVAAAGFVYVVNRDGNSVTVINAADWSQETTVAVGTTPRFASVKPDGSEVWVSSSGTADITIISTASNTVSGTIATGGFPTSVVFTADGTKAYLLNSTAPGTVQVADTTTHAITPLASSLGTITHAVLSADETTMYYAGTGFDRLVKLNLQTGTIDYAATFPFGGGHTGVATSPDSTQLWVPYFDGDPQLAILNATATEVVEIISLPGRPWGIDFSTDGKLAFVSLYNTHEVAMIDVATRDIITTIATGNEPLGLVAHESGMVAVANHQDDVLDVIGLQRERLAGSDRYATAVEVSKRGFPSGASTVFVASGGNFPDALAAGPAAGLLNASLLLTATSSLPTVVRDEITRLNPDTIYVVGGPSVVSPAVVAALQTIQPNVIRLSGSNRYATGAAIIEEAWNELTVDEVYIATGRNYPDALSAGGVASAAGIPVILVDGALSSLPQSTINLITELGATTITIAGGPSVVSSSIQTQLAAEFGAGVRRLAGADRYATSAAINLDAYPTNQGVMFATGTNFPDALSGAALAGLADMPVYLVKPNCVPEGALSAVYAGQASYMFVLGGPSVVGTAVENLTPCA